MRNRADSNMNHLLHPRPDNQILIEVTSQDAGWDYLSYSVIRLGPGDSYRHETGSTEIALVPLAGQATLQVRDEEFRVTRRSVFEELAPVLYAPPGTEVVVTTDTGIEFAVGSAPAEGRYPVRLIRPEEIRREIRGGGAARRQVCHTLAHPLPAERLILFEVYVPGGYWSGWPPHCHDGFGGSPYLEETYYFRTSPTHGFGMHRNYRIDNDFDEIFPVSDGDLVLVTQGFHSTAAAPNCNLYFLNYLAGELTDEGRATPPYDDPTFAYIKQDWDANAMPLPIVDLSE